MTQGSPLGKKIDGRPMQASRLKLTPFETFDLDGLDVFGSIEFRGSPRTAHTGGNPYHGRWAGPETAHRGSRQIMEMYDVLCSEDSSFSRPIA
jgi:hypothetical protein